MFELKGVGTMPTEGFAGCVIAYRPQIPIRRLQPAWLSWMQLSVDDSQSDNLTV
jgi:hypothetical protein